MIKSVITMVGAGILGLASLVTPVHAAPGGEGFSALEGVRAEALSTGEMDAIHGGAVTTAQVNAAMAAAMNRLGSARAPVGALSSSAPPVSAPRQATLWRAWNVRVLPSLIARGIVVR